MLAVPYGALLFRREIMLFTISIQNLGNFIRTVPKKVPLPCPD